MTKAILVLDEMPSSCEECPCCKKDENYYGDILSAECQMKYKGYLKLTDEKPDWCPLKPMPKKREYIDEDKDYPLNDDYCFSEEKFEDIVENNQISGYNKCIEDLLGE